MVLVHQIQIRTLGYPGAPGFTTLAFDASLPTFDLPQYDAVRDWIEAMKGNFPAAWSAQIEPGGRVVDEETGELSSFTDVDQTNAAPISGIASGGFGAGVAGAVIGLTTATVNRSRKVRGRIFLVPLAHGSYQTDGTLIPEMIASVEAATEALSAAGVGFGVWSRPRLGVGGKFGLVTGVRVNDRAAFLSSRRS